MFVILEVNGKSFIILSKVGISKSKKQLQIALKLLIKCIYVTVYRGLNSRLYDVRGGGGRKKVPAPSFCMIFAQNNNTNTGPTKESSPPPAHWAVVP
jgi:hypothetical protein